MTGRPTSGLHVGVNLLWLMPGVVGGSEEYTVRQLLGLAARRVGDLSVTLFALPGLRAAHPGLADEFPIVEAPLDGRTKGLRVVAESTWLAGQVWRLRCRVVHHAGGVVPLLHPGRSVLTIHDLQPLDHPENFSEVKRRYLAAMLPRSARVADVIVTPSEVARRSVVDRLGVAEEKVIHLPHGISPAAEPTGERLSADRGVLDRLGLSANRYVVYPAITYPHKDHVTLVRAFAGLVRGRADRHDLRLVLTGGAGPSDATVQEEIGRSGLGRAVIRPGRLPREDLDAVVRHAAVLAFPSRYEGFGAPVLEAQRAGCPVVAADATALPEVVADAGVLVEAGNPVAWAHALGELLDDPARREVLAARGRRLAATRTWTVTGEVLERVYRLASR